ncbi:hypothetical protein H6G58_23020 [Arthrospira platensis FACHB-971]|uniref:hypothetical protein n=1 Tax=Oscillatoriales TaxID=1150 RepID=UPI000F8114A5|nr:hypothetical protein [Arthrospira platensis FACHB-971]MDT9185365.1 hypothetical protein [Limnospira sp. PMC 289.06]MDT9309737.1 hypothetical protein [Limnospira sp. Paracas R14]
MTFLGKRAIAFSPVAVLGMLRLVGGVSERERSHIVWDGLYDYPAALWLSKTLCSLGRRSLFG